MKLHLLRPWGYLTVGAEVRIAIGSGRRGISLGRSEVYRGSVSIRYCGCRTRSWAADDMPEVKPCAKLPIAERGSEIVRGLAGVMLILGSAGPRVLRERGSALLVCMKPISGCFNDVFAPPIKSNIHCSCLGNTLFFCRDIAVSEVRIRPSDAVRNVVDFNLILRAVHVGRCKRITAAQARAVVVRIGVRNLCLD